MDLKNLITSEELQILHDICRQIPSIKNKWFSMGRDMDKFSKMCERLQRLEKGDKNECS